MLLETILKDTLKLLNFGLLILAGKHVTALSLSHVPWQDSIFLSAPGQKFLRRVYVGKLERFVMRRQNQICRPYAFFSLEGGT